MKPLSLLGAISLALSLPTQALASCGSAFCTVNTSWDVHGAWLEPGARLDLRYESIRQDQPRAGRRDIAVGEIRHHHDEVLTENRNLVGTVDYTFNQDWGVNAQLPLVHRHHEHVHNHGGAQLPESWTFTSLGDTRVLMRRRLASFEDTEKHTIGTAGVNLGVKLPTGQTNVRNGEGELAERTLQPGSGTTDFLAGLYWHAAAPLSDISWFARAQAVVPMNSREDFKPGKQLSIDAGLRYAVARDVGLMLQLNYLARGRDSGAQAEPEDSGQRMLYASPGVSWSFAKSGQLYAFLQFALYQAVTGVQLTAERSALVGASWRF
jgi:outer membrane putative beta-barrel porin/alpha-amylase